MQQGQPAPDPTCYVCAPSATDPAVAPAGGEALYVLVHTPYLRPDHDWAKDAPASIGASFSKSSKRTGGNERHRIADRLRTDINTGGSSTAATVCSMERSMGLRVTATFSARSNRAIGARMCADFILPVGPRIPVPVCQWPSCRAGSPPTLWIRTHRVGTLRSRARDKIASISARGACRRFPCLIVRLFAAYSRWYMLRRFHAIRVLRKGQPPRDSSRAAGNLS